MKIRQKNTASVELLIQNGGDHTKTSEKTKRKKTSTLGQNNRKRPILDRPNDQQSQ